MAHFAKVESGIVTDILVAEQDFIDTLEGDWVQTSYNTYGGVHALGGTPLRKNFAGIGYTYDSERDAFILPFPEDSPSWVLNETTCIWEAPVSKPDDDELGYYDWEESSLSWVKWNWDEDTESWVRQ